MGQFFLPLLTQPQVEGHSVSGAGKLCELKIASQHSREQAAPPQGVGSTSRAWNFTARGARLAPSQTQVKDLLEANQLLYIPKNVQISDVPRLRLCVLGRPPDLSQPCFPT